MNYSISLLISFVYKVTVRVSALTSISHKYSDLATSVYGGAALFTSSVASAVPLSVPLCHESVTDDAISTYIKGSLTLPEYLMIIVPRLNLFSYTHEVTKKSAK